MPLTITKEKTVYSFSRLSLFDERCERAFYHKYIEQRPEPSGMPAIIGKIFHLAIDLVVSEGYSPEDAVNCAIFVNNGLPEGETVHYMVAMVKRAYQRLQQYNSEYTDLLSELHLEVETEDIKLQGFIDICVDDPSQDEVTIIDWKTTWQPFTDDDAHYAKQLKLYAWMFKQMRGGIVASSFKGRFVFPRVSESKDLEFQFTDEELAATYEWAVDVSKKIEDKNPDNIHDWKMTTNRSICEHCPRSTLCSGGFLEGLPGDGEPKDKQEASAIGDYIRMQELALKRMKEGLKNFAKENGPITGMGGRWDFSLSEPSPKIPIDIVKEYAEKHDLDLDEVLNTDNKTLKRWIEEDSTGFLASQAKWTSPRNSFRFIGDPKKKEEKGASKK